MGFGVLTCSLNAEHLADTEALVLDELAGAELGYTGGTSRGIGRDETAGEGSGFIIVLRASLVTPPPL